MNHNNNEVGQLQKPHELHDILLDVQRLESLHELIRAEDGAGLRTLSPLQQLDIHNIAADLTLDIRCRLAQVLPEILPG